MSSVSEELEDAVRRNIAVSPEIPVIDAHMHLWHGPNGGYFAKEYLADVAAAGHEIFASVHVECNTDYRSSGPAEMAAIGETEFVVDQSLQSDGSGHRLASAIVGNADLRLGSAVGRVLDGHLKAAPERFCGIRQRLSWDPEQAVAYPGHDYPDSYAVFDDPALLAGAKCLSHRGLVLNALVFHTQLDALVDFAGKVEDLKIVVDHCGFPVGVGRFASQRDEVFRHWLSGMRRLAELPNVYVKLDGMGISRFGLGLGDGDREGRAMRALASWKPFVAGCLETFGPERCIYATNAPVDSSVFSMRQHINFYKLMLADQTLEDRHSMFWRNAADLFSIAGPQRQD